MTDAAVLFIGKLLFVGQAILPPAAFQAAGAAGKRVRRLDSLPHNAAGRKRCGRVPGIVRAAGRRINNPPQVDNLPHMAARRKLGTGEIVAARKDLN